ncbi:hypothetical protein PM082_002114 [Marasmius tenuissimus]|nr:hypothetical protein PM082_002114 [Marasmius tenuissimus]
MTGSLCRRTYQFLPRRPMSRSFVLFALASSYFAGTYWVERMESFSSSASRCISVTTSRRWRVQIEDRAIWPLRLRVVLDISCNNWAIHVNSVSGTLNLEARIQGSNLPPSLSCFVDIPFAARLTQSNIGLALVA